MDGVHCDRVVNNLVARGPGRNMLRALTGAALASLFDGDSEIAAAEMDGGDERVSF
jgi:hypothetical protein